MKLVERHLLKVAKEVAYRLAKKQGSKIVTFNKLQRTDDLHKHALGYCTSDGEIRIEFRKGHTKYKYNPIDKIILTVAHEVAHLKDMTHGKVWKKHYQKNKRLVKKLYL